jgi:uncharacterized membrane protein YeaQ/YmgE (transglycosylase-associated protein family)
VKEKEMLGLFLLIAIGLVVGGLANFFTHGGGLGTVGNIVVGIVGSLLGGLLFQQVGISLTGWIEESVVLASYGVAFAVAVILLVIASLIKK